jgi:hypothetical protein
MYLGCDLQAPCNLNYIGTIWEGVKFEEKLQLGVAEKKRLNIAGTGER